MTLSVQINWHIVFGLAVAMILGMGIGCLVKKVGDQIPLLPPSDDLLEDWKVLTTMNSGGRWIGFVERPIFFTAIWFQAWVLIGAWLVMKTAFYWQSANFAAYPVTLPSSSEAKYLIAKRRIGTHHTATALVGTGASIIAALIGVAAGKWILF